MAGEHVGTGRYDVRIIEHVGVPILIILYIRSKFIVHGEKLMVRHDRRLSMERTDEMLGVILWDFVRRACLCA